MSSPEAGSYSKAEVRVCVPAREGRARMKVSAARIPRAIMLFSCVAFLSNLPTVPTVPLQRFALLELLDAQAHRHLSVPHRAGLPLAKPLLPCRVCALGKGHVV